jgi:hypothetical protein
MRSSEKLTTGKDKEIIKKMKDEMIQTLHPQADKTNKKILLSKYNFIKENILAILSDKELTHTELMEELFLRVKDNFDGGVQWYGETVKLDLEARQIIERTKSKLQKYKLTAPSVVKVSTDHG